MVPTQHENKSQSNFRERLDRHGKPFGERVSVLANRVQGPRNKIVPYFTYVRSNRDEMIYRPKNTPSQHNNSPPLPRQRDQQKSPQGRTAATDHPEAGVWRSKTPPTTEVLNEINEATLRYTNVDDPIERAARQQRVLQSEIDGSVEQTVEHIIQHSAASLGIPVDSILQPHSLSDAAQEVVETSQETTAPKRRGRHHEHERLVRSN
ncbi:Uncharacterized protein Rs2_38829 [Raphanus sativus]|nr:Uncharacterized protein Rs2_38829 [Raphanus sativus]